MDKLNSIWNYLTSIKGLVGLIKDKDGKFSSKRAAGLTLVYFGYNAIVDGNITEFDQLISYVVIIGIGGVLLAASAFEKKA